MPKMFRLLAVLLTFALIAVACGGDDDETASADSCEVGETDGDLSLYNWSEYIDPDLVDAFEAEFGVTVTESFYDSNEAMQPIVTAGNSGHDVIVPSDYMISILIEAAEAGETSVMKLNRNALPNLANLAPEFASDLPFDPNGEWAAPYQWGTTGIGVNLNVTGEDIPETWGLLFDADIAAQYGLDGAGATLLNDPRETMGAALKYLGYSLNSTSEAELEEAKQVIIDAKSRVTAFDSDQGEELLVTGDVAISHGYSGNFLAEFDGVEDEDANFTYFVPQEGGTRWVDGMMVVADAPHPCTAHTFINFILDAENGAQLTNWNYYASPNGASVPFIDDEILNDPIVYPSDMSKLEFIRDTGDYETNFSDAFIEAKG